MSHHTDAMRGQIDYLRFLGCHAAAAAVRTYCDAIERRDRLHDEAHVASNEASRAHAVYESHREEIEAAARRDARAKAPT